MLPIASTVESNRGISTDVVPDKLSTFGICMLAVVLRLTPVNSYFVLLT